MNPIQRRHRAIGVLMTRTVVSTPPSLPFARHAVARYMTSTPHCIDRDQTLATAHTLMQMHGIRHLPVLDAGKLAGILSQRDLYFVEALRATDQDTVTVDEAMSQEAFSVRPESTVEEVALEMADRKYGCAVVMEGGRVVGVFTTTDALRALAELAHARA